MAVAFVLDGSRGGVPGGTALDSSVRYTYTRSQVVCPGMSGALCEASTYGGSTDIVGVVGVQDSCDREALRYIPACACILFRHPGDCAKAEARVGPRANKP